MSFKIVALETVVVNGLQSGGADSNGQPPERTLSDGDGNPCRHCLGEVAAGDPMLIMGHRPFHTIQPYAEVGPVFLCADRCNRYPEISAVPDLYRDRSMLIRGYDSMDRIVYGTGVVVVPEAFQREVSSLLRLPRVTYLHARSPTNNCFHFRIDPA